MDIKALSVQAIRKPPEDLAREFDRHKWETIFHDDRVVHTAGDSSISIWRKKERIGAGGYGTVWLQEEECGTVCPRKPWRGKELRAVKMLDRDPHISTCQIQELQALVMLKEYPRLFVNFLGWYETLEHTFLAMEYIKDGDLSKYIADHEGGPKPIVEVKEITRQILHGLGVLHSLKIYHRDLKPQNILVACLDPIWVKIADFGVAKREASTSLRTQVGTYGYMAPELLGYFPRRKPRKPAYALDMWSLGILVHEIVTFKTPFCIRETDPEPELNPDSDPESDSSIYETDHGSASGTFSLDEDLLKGYCLGHEGFPVDLLERSQLDKEGIDFLKALLAATPKERLTAASALMSPWLEEPDLKKEFLLLGLDPDQSYWGEQITYQLYPETKSVPLLKEATRKGYNLAIEKLLQVTPIDDYIIKELFLLAIKSLGLQYETANTLLRRGRRHLRSLADEEEVLHWALKMRYTEVIDIFLEGGIFLKGGIFLEGRIFLGGGIFLEGGIFDITPSYWEKLYHPVIRTGNLEILKRVIKRADINHMTGSGSPLEVAARFGCIDTVNLLLDNGADGTPEALYSAIEGGHLGVVRVLLDRVVEIGKKLQPGTPAILESAASLGYLEVVKLLLERGADVKGSPNAVPFAASGGHMEVVKLLLDNGASAGDNPKVLTSALTSGHPEAEGFLLDSGADPRGAPAAKGGHSDVAKPLLDDGALVDEQTEVIEQLRSMQLKGATRK